MSLFGRMKKTRNPVVVSGLDKTVREEELCELRVRGGSDNAACVVCVGGKGSGKSATISRFDLTPADATNNCTLYQPTPGSSPGAVRLPWIEESMLNQSVSFFVLCLYNNRLKQAWCAQSTTDRSMAKWFFALRLSCT